MKTIQLLSIIILGTVLVSACKKDSPSGPVTRTAGQKYQGGIIGYVDATGQHGLIVSEKNVSDASPWASTNEYFDATNTGLGKGKKNTDIMLTFGAKATSANLCSQYRGGGFTDWFLPSLDELYAIYKNRELINRKAEGLYWTSTEADKTYAHVQNFLGGNYYPCPKTRECSVMPVRSF